MVASVFEMYRVGVMEKCFAARNWNSWPALALSKLL